MRIPRVGDLPPLPPLAPQEDDFTDEELDALFQAFAQPRRDVPRLVEPENLAQPAPAVPGGIDYGGAPNIGRIAAGNPETRGEASGRPGHGH
jgi:hypothetical protein